MFLQIFKPEEQRDDLFSMETVHLGYFPQIKKERSKDRGRVEGRRTDQTRRGKVTVPLCFLIVLLKQELLFGYFMS